MGITYCKRLILKLTKFTWIFILLTSPLLSVGQITFEKLFGGTNTESAYRVAICRDGGYITAGYTRSLGTGIANMHLIRTDIYGEQLWEAVIGGTVVDKAYAVAVTNGGEFVAVGSTTSFGAGQEDILVVKLDSSGNKLWQKTFGGPGFDEGWDIRQTTDGGYIISGVSNSFGAKFFDAILLKIDSEGNEQWKKLYGGSSTDVGFCIRQTADGGYAFLGQTLSSGEGQGDFYMVKTDANGNKEWEKTYGDSLPEEGRYFAITNDGGYILIGKTESYGAGGEDIYVIKIDSAGNMLWSKTYGGNDKDTGKSIEQTSDGGFIIASSSRSFNWINPNAWFIKTDNNGTQQWAKDYGGWYHDHGHHILPTADGGYIATGHFNQLEAQKEDTYLLKLDSNGNWYPDAKDAGIVKVLNPLNGDCSNSSTKVSIEIKNYGNAKLTAISLKVNIIGSLTRTLQENFQYALAPGESAAFTFEETIDIPINSNFQLIASIDILEDVNKNNNEKSEQLIIGSQTTTAVDLGPDVKTQLYSYELDAGAGFNEYLWSTNETSQKITIATSGKYWVRVKDSNGCGSFDDVLVSLPTGINNQTYVNNLKIFPNPTNGIVEVSLNSESYNTLEINIINSIGQIVFNYKTQTTEGFFTKQIDMQTFSPGIYLVGISDGQRLTITKVLLQ